MQPSADVLIIGAGLSGLAAATFLKHKEPDLSLLIIEQGIIRRGYSLAY
ncbi:NAD(P)-binding protein [Desulfobulbus sp. N3]|nr:NAD(P)-binding protein [Desulfobulbus sp. N3]